MNLHPLKITFLPTGAFSNYTALRQAEGADLAQLKPPHINPSEKILSLLLEGGKDTASLVDTISEHASLPDQ